MAGVLVPGAPLPGAVFPGMVNAHSGLPVLIHDEQAQSRLEAAHRHMDEQELLGGLASTLTDNHQSDQLGFRSQSAGKAGLTYQRLQSSQPQQWSAQPHSLPPDYWSIQQQHHQAAHELRQQEDHERQPQPPYQHGAKLEVPSRTHSQRHNVGGGHPNPQVEGNRSGVHPAAKPMRQRREAEDIFLAQQAQIVQVQAQRFQAPINATQPDASSILAPAGNVASSTAPQLGMVGQSNMNRQAASTPSNVSSGNPGLTNNMIPFPPGVNGGKMSGLQSSQASIAVGSVAIPSLHQLSRTPQPIVCEFCGRWLSEMALDQGNHMCDEFWEYNAEFQARGSQCALLIGGIRHLKPEHLQSFIMRFPGMRRVKHGSSLSESNGLFMLTDEQRQTQALRLLSNCGVRSIPLGHAASWRCLHVQLAPLNSPQRVGQAEQALQNKLLRAMQQHQSRSAEVASTTTMGRSEDSSFDSLVVSRGKAAAEAWEVRAQEAKRRMEPQPLSIPPLSFHLNPQMLSGGGPGSTPGDWKCGNCGNINFAFREKCNRCNTHRPGARLFGQSAASERRICPFTVMLMRVPSHASEAQVAEALLQFGEVTPGGIKFHRQGAKNKQRRARLPLEGLALHAFCRFIRPQAAAASLQRGEVTILGQAVQINPAFMRGAVPAEVQARAGFIGGVVPGVGGHLAYYPDTFPVPVAMPPLPPGMPTTLVSDPDGFGMDNLGMDGLGMDSLGMDSLSSFFETMSPLDNQTGSMEPMVEKNASAASNSFPLQDAKSITPGPNFNADSFLSVALQTLWHIDGLRETVCGISTSSDGLVNGIQALFRSLSENAALPPSSQLLSSLLPSIFIQHTARRISTASEASEGFESFLSLIAAASDARLSQSIEQFFSLSITEMCDCVCDEVLEPLHFRQSCAYAAVSKMISDSPGQQCSIHEQTASGIGPVCPTANCSSVMRIHRYLKTPTPALLSIGLVWETAGAQAASIRLLLQKIPQQIDLQQAFHGVEHSVSANIKAVVCTSNSKFCAFAMGVNLAWLMFDEETLTVVGNDWKSVVSKCIQSNLQPCVIIYQVQELNGPKTVI